MHIYKLSHDCSHGCKILAFSPHKSIYKPASTCECVPGTVEYSNVQCSAMSLWYMLVETGVLQIVQDPKIGKFYPALVLIAKVKLVSHLNGLWR